MSIYKISEIIGEKKLQINASPINFPLITRLYRREEPLTPNLLYSWIDPNDTDEYDLNPITLSEAIYNENYASYEDFNSEQIPYDETSNGEVANDEMVNEGEYNDANFEAELNNESQHVDEMQE